MLYFYLFTMKKEIWRTRPKVLWESTTPRKSWSDLPAHECGQLNKRLRSTQHTRYKTK